MIEKQMDFKKIIPTCPNCEKPMAIRPYDYGLDTDLISHEREYHSDKDDLIQNRVAMYYCYNCNVKTFVLERTQTQRLDDKLLDTVIPKPEPKFYYKETIYDLPETAKDHEYFYIRKGYYDFAHCENGIWVYSKEDEEKKRCEDCSYYSPGNVYSKEYQKEHPEKDGAPSGFCRHAFRMKENCPMWDNGEN